MSIAEQYSAILPELSASLRQIAKQLKEKFNDDFIIETDIKTLESTIRKGKDKKTDQIVEFSDLIRGRLFFPDKYTYDQVLQKLISIFGKQIKKIEWQRSYEHGLSYRGIVHLDIYVNGFNFELQVIPKGFMPYIKPQHRIYELVRDNDKMNNKKKNRLIELHNRIFDLLENKYL